MTTTETRVEALINDFVKTTDGQEVMRYAHDLVAASDDPNDAAFDAMVNVVDEFEDWLFDTGLNELDDDEMSEAGEIVYAMLT